MTDQKQSSADIASRAMEEAKARLSPEEFRLFVYLFNAQYLYTKMQVGGFDLGVLTLFTAGLVQPLIYDHAEENGISEGRANDLREEARQVVITAFEAAVIPTKTPNYPGVYGLIIDRARAEGFDVPTLEQIDMNAKAAPEGKYLDFDALMASERFHFQTALSRIRQGKSVAPEFFKPTE